MSNIPYLTMYASSEVVSNADYVDIDFSSAGFTNLPIIVVSSEENINTHISNLTTSTARINFSSTFTGRVSYIIRDVTT